MGDQATGDPDCVTMKVGAVGWLVRHASAVPVRYRLPRLDPVIHHDSVRWARFLFSLRGATREAAYCCSPIDAVILCCWRGEHMKISSHNSGNKTAILYTYPCPNPPPSAECVDQFGSSPAELKLASASSEFRF